MKKILALLLCLLMVLSLAFSMTACDSKKKDDDEDEEEKSSSQEKGDDEDEDEDEDEEKAKTPEELIIGKWVLTYSAEDVGIDMDDVLGDLPEDFDMPEFKLNCIMEFTSDEMTMSFDKDSFDDFINDFKKALKKYVSNNDLEVTDEDIDEVINTAFGDFDGIFDETQTAEYRIEGNEIILITDGEEDPAEFEVTKTTLKITSDGITMELKRK